MKYNGIELIKITEPQILDPPKKMLVWNNIMDYTITSLVVAIVERMDGICAICHDGEIYPYCAEIPEAPKPRRVTNRELSKWLAQGNGETKDICDIVMPNMCYIESKCNDEVFSKVKVRKWEDEDWHEPTADYLGLEG